MTPYSPPKWKVTPVYKPEWDCPSGEQYNALRYEQRDEKENQNENT